MKIHLKTIADKVEAAILEHRDNLSYIELAQEEYLEFIGEMQGCYDSIIPIGAYTGDFNIAGMLRYEGVIILCRKKE